jgi:type II secretory pathway predicted ATPase ExeA
MYAAYWMLSESPFSCRPDGRWFHSSVVHDEALSRLMYVVEAGRRCGVLRGESGVGKSLLLQVLARNARRASRQVVVVDLWDRGGAEVAWEVASGLGLAPLADDRPERLWRRLQDSLHGPSLVHTPVVMAFDHVERAQPDALSALRRLFHLHGAGSSGVSFVLAAGTERQGLVASLLNDLSDLRIDLPALDREQTHRFVDGLLAAAGAKDPIFTLEALDLVYDLTHGVPRDINRLCDVCMLGGMTCDETQIDETSVAAAAAELNLAPRHRRRAAPAAV